MNPNSITSIAHQMIRPLINSQSVVVDATCGNGKDSYYLASICRSVYAFDIQQKALDNAKLRNSSFSNITYILDSFENIKNHLKTFNGVVFNLGYLPGGDKKITTTSDTTIKTLHSLFNDFYFNFFILLVIYTGHQEGLKEALAIDSFLNENKIKYQKYQVNHQSKKAPPYIILIENTK